MNNVATIFNEHLFESSVLERELERVKGITTDLLWKPLPERFLEGLTQCKFEHNYAHLRGIFVQDTAMVSTDELRIHWYEMDAKMDTFWIDEAPAGELRKVKTLKGYALTKEWVHFRTEDGAVFSCKRLAHDKYPFKKIQAIAKEHAKAEGDISVDLPVKLREAVDRAAPIDIESHETVQLTFSPEGIDAYNGRPEEKYHEHVPWDSPVGKKFKPVSFNLDIDMFHYGFKKSKSVHIKQIGKGKKIQKRLVFQGERLMHIVSTFRPTVG